MLVKFSLASAPIIEELPPTVLRAITCDSWPAPGLAQLEITLQPRGGA